MLSPIAIQFMVAGSTHLAALSIGGVVAYPSVLLQQFKSNDTIIHLDIHKGSWIGSVHGIAGIPCILMPLLMQYKGRKIAFLLSCVVIIIGWLLAYMAQNLTTLIIAECFHGFGGDSLLAVSFLSVSEMVQPKYRNTCLSLYGALQALGVSIIGILGRYLHWKTVALVMSCPVLLAIPIGCAWPESPSWLAWKGNFEECEKNFGRLRGSDEKSRQELDALVSSQQKSKIKVSNMQKLRDLRNNVTRRDFYLPSLHNILVLSVIYWGGGMPAIVYSSDMIIKASGKPNPPIRLFMDISFFVGYTIASILVRYYNTRNVMMSSMASSAFFLGLASAATYLRSVGVLAEDSELGVYFLAGFVATMSLGDNSFGFTLACELMPVKHRGIGGCLFVICTCLFHTSTLKAYPYLCVYINIWGVLLLYSIYKFTCVILMWKYIPETKNRTLQEIEEYYNIGYFKNNLNRDEHVETSDDKEVGKPFIGTEKCTKSESVNI